MEQKVSKNILVDIDAIMDTRLPIVYALSAKELDKLTLNKAYHSRLKDNFGNISQDIFKAMYNNRNKGILSMALPTPMLNLVRESYGEVKTNVLKLASGEDVIIYLNTYPYELNHTEQINMMKVIDKYIPKATIKIVNMSNSELTPSWVEDNVDTIIKYDSIDWLELNMANGNLVNNPLMGTILLAPALVSGIIDSKTVKKNTFIDLSNAAASVITLMCIDAFYYSAVMKK